MSRVKIVHVLNKRTKKDLIDTCFKRIIARPAVNYNTNKLSTFNRRGLVCGFYFIIFISGIQFSRGIVCLRQRQSRQSMHRNGGGGVEAKVVILLCQAVFPWETVRGGVPCTAPPTQYWP